VWDWFDDTFEGPSPPQEASWPRIAQGQNTLIFSPTGSGKTLASFLWCINYLFRKGSEQKLEDAVYVLYVSPLKALNNDIQKNLIAPLQGIQGYAKRAGVEVPEIRSLVRTGDTTAKQRAAMSRRPPHILITTPESLYIILTTAQFREAFRTVRYVIVDEIHAMSNNKRGVHLSLSLERLEHLVSGSNRNGAEPSQTGSFVRIGLSATQKPLDQIAHFLSGIGPDGAPRACEIVDVGARKNLDVQVISPVDNLLEAQFDAIWGSAYDQMLSLIRQHETTLIFSNSRYKTERTALRLTELSAAESYADAAVSDTPTPAVAVGAHHGSLSKNVRLDMESRLKRGELDALVATASLELGIDVGSIDLVCQIQSAKSVSTGMQRIGRAGHLLDATSKGRILVTDRDDLVESSVLVRAIVDGQIDTTRIPTNCLDVLAQQIVAAVAADEWHGRALYELCRQSYCYRDLDYEDYERVLDMLSGNYVFDVEYPPYPKITWDKVNNVLYPERSARLIAFRSGGTIPDISDYDVYLESKQTRVGRLDEGFVEQLHTGDIFILGSSSWRVLGISRNRVLVEDVYGRAPTIPFWGGDRDSRTYDLGVLVGQFRAAVDAMLDSGVSEADLIDWLCREYHVDQNGARSIHEYCREQKLITGELPTDTQLLIERFQDELGLQQIVIHSPFGIRVHDSWAMVLQQAIQEQYGFQPQTATIDDGILLTIPKDKSLDLESTSLLEWVTPKNLTRLAESAILHSPVFFGRFRHTAVRSLMVLREYRGRKTPVWLQSLRSTALLEACHEDRQCPLVQEALRECMSEALDVPNLRQVIDKLASGQIRVRTVTTRIPSPFSHSLLLLGQYGDMGSIPTRERRTRMMHLHRELLKQILDEETLQNLLDPAAVQEVEDRLQHTAPHRRARTPNELARILLELGDMVGTADQEISLLDRIGSPKRAQSEPEGEPDALALVQMLSELCNAHRAVSVPIPTAETNRQRWIATENLPLYSAAFATPTTLDETDHSLLQILADKGPLSQVQTAEHAGLNRREAQTHLAQLLNSYHVLYLPLEQQVGAGDRQEIEMLDDTPTDQPTPVQGFYVAAHSWVPERILQQRFSRREARVELVHRYLRQHGPVTKYEVMDRYGFPEPFVEHTLDALYQGTSVVRGEYLPTKAVPQWCYKSNLEQIHRLTLNRLRQEMEPATPAQYTDFLMRWQHVHPATRQPGVEGLRSTIQALQGQENYQIVYERDIFPTRVPDYSPAMLDRLCYGGEVFWRRFDHRTMRRGQIGFCFRRDLDWIVADPAQAEMELDRWDDDIPDACDAVRGFLRQSGACFFDDIVRGTRLDERLVLRAVWHLVWTGEATNDSYESIRHAAIASGLSACYDLGTKPGRKGVTLDFIVGHMLDLRKLDPRLGRWAPTERLVPSVLHPPEVAQAAAAWANLLLLRYGIVSHESYRREVCPLPWKEIRRALVKQELLGKVRRGFFVQDLSGEQYAHPEAIDALRDEKLRQLDANSNGATSLAQGPITVLNACDPANPYGTLFAVTTQSGAEFKFVRVPQKYLVLQQGEPLLLYEGRVRLLVDLSRERAEQALQALIQLVSGSPQAAFPQPARLPELDIRDWNGHPIDVSPARHLLTRLGFVPVENRWKGYVFDELHRPSADDITKAEQEIPDYFWHEGKETAPVAYDAQWIISRSHADIQDKVRELIAFLHNTLPPECEIVYQPRQFQVRYRGFRCMTPYIQRKQIWLQITHKGWTRGISIQPETDLSSPQFAAQVDRQFARTRQQIDALIESSRH